MSDEYESLREDAEFNKMLKQFERVLKSKSSTYFDVYQFERIIDHYLDGNNFVEAIDAVNMGIRLHPSATSLVIKQAQIFAEKGEPSKALSILVKVDKIESTNNELHLLKGMVYNQLGKISEAEKAFDEALKFTFDDRDEVLFDIALSFEYIHHYKTAIKYLLKALDDSSEKLNIIYELAHCYEKIHDYNKTIVYYKQYLDLEPFADSVWHNLGFVYFKMEDYGKAIDAYDYTIAINDRFSSAYLNKAIALTQSGKFEDALIVYEEFLKLEPENVVAMCHMGECLEKIKKYEIAINWYKKAAGLDPEFSDAWFGLAVCSQYQSEHMQALIYIEKAIELDEENSDYWYTLGNLKASLGHYKNAMIAYRKAIELDPYDYEAWLNLADLEYDHNGITNAIRILKDAYDFNFDIAEVNYHLSAFYCLDNRSDLAHKFFEKGLKISFEDHTVAFRYCPALKDDTTINRLINKYKSIP
ncbi:MAG: tetratricopeptide repeat protein [Bacteroidales bacterium]|nr:tetratricopeptide repeat protein [Bacteroidales bacterium]